MSDRRIYMDHNATTPLRPEAREAMLAAVDFAGSASSPHAEGRAARRLVEDARDKVGRLVGAAAKTVVFTSGASEANTMALSLAWARGGRSLGLSRGLVGAIEHQSVLAGGRIPQAALERIPADAEGRIDLAALEARLAALATAGERALVSVMVANNETGVMQPFAAAAALARAAGGLSHGDAAQAAGKVPVDVRALGADLLTLSSHKLGGPFGAGALVIADGLHLEEPLIRGGGQEKGLRAGTENVAAIAGFGAAAEAARLALSDETRHVRALRDRLETGLRSLSPEIVVFGESVERLPNTLLFAVAGIAAETALIALDLEGIAVSSGSACSSGKVKASHVLAAMDVAPELSRSALRLSLGRDSTVAEVECVLAAWKRLRDGLHERRRVEAA